MLYRNLFYTGISRAKQLLVLVGSEEVRLTPILTLTLTLTPTLTLTLHPDQAIAAAVGNDAMQRRDTMLTERVADDEVAPFCVKHE